jgi:hypothetical protein
MHVYLNIHTYTNACIHACIFIYTHIHIHTYIHTYIHTHITGVGDDDDELERPQLHMPIEIVSRLKVRGVEVCMYVIYMCVYVRAYVLLGSWYVRGIHIRDMYIYIETCMRTYVHTYRSHILT